MHRQFPNLLTVLRLILAGFFFWKFPRPVREIEEDEYEEYEEYEAE